MQCTSYAEAIAQTSNKIPPLPSTRPLAIQAPRLQRPPLKPSIAAHRHKKPSKIHPKAPPRSLAPVRISVPYNALQAHKYGLYHHSCQHNRHPSHCDSRRLAASCKPFPSWLPHNLRPVRKQRSSSTGIYLQQTDFRSGPIV